MAGPVLTRIQGAGRELGAAIRQTNAARAAAKHMADALFASPDPKKVSEALRLESEALRRELEAYKLLQEESRRDPTLLKRAGLQADQLGNLIEMTRGTLSEVAPKYRAVRMVQSLRELGAHHYLCSSKELFMTLNALVGVDGKIVEVRTDPVTGARTYALELKDGLRIRLTEELAPARKAASEPRLPAVEGLPDMAKVMALVETYAERGFRNVFARLLSEGRVFALTEAGLLEAVTARQQRAKVHAYKMGEPIPEFTPPEEVVREYIKGKWLEDLGAYDPHTGFLFIKPGALDSVARTVVHEVTHYLQDEFRLKLAGVPDQGTFKAEIGAHLMEQRMLKKMVASGKNGPLPRDDKELLDTKPEKIHELILDRYDQFKLPEGFNEKEIERLVEQTLKMLQRFH